MQKADATQANGLMRYISMDRFFWLQVPEETICNTRVVVCLREVQIVQNTRRTHRETFLKLDTETCGLLTARKKVGDQFTGFFYIRGKLIRTVGPQDVLSRRPCWFSEYEFAIAPCYHLLYYGLMHVDAP